MPIITPFRGIATPVPAVVEIPTNTADDARRTPEVGVNTRRADREADRDAGISAATQKVRIFPIRGSETGVEATDSGPDETALQERGESRPRHERCFPQRREIV